MSRHFANDWVIVTLDDISGLLASNGLQDAVDAIRVARGIIQASGGGQALLGKTTPLVTRAMAGCNVVRISDYLERRA